MTGPAEQAARGFGAAARLVAAAASRTTHRRARMTGKGYVSTAGQAELGSFSDLPDVRGVTEGRSQVSNLRADGGLACQIDDGADHRA